LCPQCKARLPARYALAIRAVALRCPTCRVQMRATRESLLSTSRAVLMPCAQAGAIVGAVGLFIAVRIDRWWVFVAAMGVFLVLSWLWSWRVGLRHIEFERA
jgi:hypothetical protein